jgi:hypothetical protein
VVNYRFSHLKKIGNNRPKPLLSSYLRRDEIDLVISCRAKIWEQTTQTINFELGRGWDIPRRFLLINGGFPGSVLKLCGRRFTSLQTVTGASSNQYIFKFPN